METIHVSQAGEDGQELDAGSPTIVQVQIPNQPVQVQSVIHSQPSVIQTAGGHIQAIQVVAPVTEGDTDEEGDGSAKKRRDILARRPSYRWVLNELTGEPGAVTIGKVEDDSDESEDSRETNGAVANLRSMVPAQTIQIAAHGDGTTQGLQTLTMSNATASQANTGATIVQYAQGPDGQFFIPAGQVQAYQISAPQASLPQGVVMATSPALTSPQQITEEASRKRELRLLKNREAARECRRKKKDYVKCLENRVAVLENQNKALIEELKSLKELYCQKEG